MEHDYTTGQGLYEAWVAAQLRHNNCECDGWDELPDTDHTAWDALSMEINANIERQLNESE